jgi:hypothetical protein
VHATTKKKSKHPQSKQLQWPSVALFAAPRVTLSLPSRPFVAARAAGQTATSRCQRSKHAALVHAERTPRRRFTLRCPQRRSMWGGKRDADAQPATLSCDSTTGDKNPANQMEQPQGSNAPAPEQRCVRTNLSALLLCRRCPAAGARRVPLHTNRVRSSIPIGDVRPQHQEGGTTGALAAGVGEQRCLPVLASHRSALTLLRWQRARGSTPPNRCSSTQCAGRAGTRARRTCRGTREMLRSSAQGFLLLVVRPADRRPPLLCLRSVVAIHNTVNERAWREVLAWEAMHHTCARCLAASSSLPLTTRLPHLVRSGSRARPPAAARARAPGWCASSGGRRTTARRRGC